MEQSSVAVAMIVAQSSNRVIGIDNTLPWHLPEDLKYFKSVTMGKPVIMGRKTYESIGRPLPGRKNIVITRQSGWSADGVAVVHNLQAAVDLAQKEALVAAATEVMVIGGAQIYCEALPLAQRIYMTQVDADLSGDAFFPALDELEWQQTASSEAMRGEIDGREVAYVFTTLERTADCS